MKYLLKWIAFGAVFGVLGYAGYHYFFPTSHAPIVVSCAVALRVPMEKIAADYYRETGRPVEIRYDSSQAILAKMEITRDVDLFFPADDSFVHAARKKDLVGDSLPVAQMSAVVIVAPNVPHEVKTWQDFLAFKEKICLADKSAAIGKVVREHLEKKGLWSDLERCKPTNHGKIDEVAASVQIGSASAGIVWDSFAHQYPKTKIVRLPELNDLHAKIEIAVTKFAKNSPDAYQFARYVAGKDKGLPTFAEHKYDVVQSADVYAERPKLILHGGTMFRNVIEKTLDEFRQREGVEILTKYDGCGILVAGMKSSYPDIFIACEPRFLKMVQDQFHPPVTVSANALVLAMKKDDPLVIESLEDLAQEGVRLGVGHENKCALGTLTDEAFKAAQAFSKKKTTFDRIEENIAKRAIAGDMLVSDLKAGGLNVIVCYESNVRPYADTIRYQSITTVMKSIPRECSHPDQPVAILKETKSPELARRLLAALTAPESQRRFEEVGFAWKLK